MVDQFNNAIPIGRLEGLTISIPHIDSCHPIASNPPHCSIDARQPSEPDGSEVVGPQSIDLQLRLFCGPGAPTCDAFNVTQEPAGLPAIRCSSITPNIVPGDPSWIRLNFDRTISTRRWTCVEFVAEGRPFCISHLPGDVGGDRVVATPADVNRLINCLDLDPPCDISQCDLNRSGLCTSEDLNREADLQNGGDQYIVWRGLDIPSACPPQ